MYSALLAMILLLPSSDLLAQAAPSVVARLVNIGGISLTIPVPTGFADPAPSAPELRALAEQMTPPTNRLLVNFVLISDLRRHSSGQDADLDRYLFAQTARFAEDQLVSKANFSKLKSSMRQKKDEQTDRNVLKVNKLLAQMSKEESHKHGTAISLELGEVVPLGIIAETDSSLILGYLSRVAVRRGKLEDVRTMITILSAVAVKSKIVFLYTYSTFRSPKDIEWAKLVAQQWTAQLLNAN